MDEKHSEHHKVQKMAVIAVDEDNQGFIPPHVTSSSQGFLGGYFPLTIVKNAFGMCLPITC